VIENSIILYYFIQLHLFDADLGERMKIVESDINLPGGHLTTVDTGNT